MEMLALAISALLVPTSANRLFLFAKPEVVEADNNV